MASHDPPDQAPAAGAAVPIGVERVLQRAAQDRDFLEELKARRSQAAQDVGIELTETEATLLDTIDPARMAQMVASLPPAIELPEHDQHLDMDPTRGIRPDEMPITGVRPDGGPVKGIRPGVKVAVAAGAVLAAGACATMLITAGSRPDAPPPAAGPEPSRQDKSAAGPDAGKDAEADAASEAPPAGEDPAAQDG